MLLELGPMPNIGPSTVAGCIWCSGQAWVLWHRDGSPKEGGVLSNLDTSCVEAAGSARCAHGPLETFQWLPA